MTENNRAGRVWDAITAHARRSGAPASVGTLCEVAQSRLSAVGVAVSARGRTVASEVLSATSGFSRELEELQLTLGEGPSLDVLAGSRAVLIEALNTTVVRDRWPLFTPLALKAGARAVFALPLRSGAIQFGVLTLYRDVPGMLLGEHLAQARVFAGLALELLLDQLAGISQHDGVYPGDGLSGGRPEVHQAVGMISVQLGGVGVGEAFIRLRAHAFAADRSLSEVAADVLARRLRFDPEDTG